MNSCLCTMWLNQALQKGNQTAKYRQILSDTMAGNIQKQGCVQNRQHDGTPVPELVERSLPFLPAVCFYLSFLRCVRVWVTCPQLYTFSFLNKLWPTHSVILSLLPTEDHLDQEEFYSCTPCFSDSWECRWHNQVLTLPNAEEVPREVLSLQLCLKALIRLFAA